MKTWFVVSAGAAEAGAVVVEGTALERRAGTRRAQGAYTNSRRHRIALSKQAETEELKKRAVDGEADAERKSAAQRAELNQLRLQNLAMDVRGFDVD